MGLSGLVPPVSVVPKDQAMSPFWRSGRRLHRCLLALVPLLLACHPRPVFQPAIHAQPTPNEADAKVIVGFLSAYGHRDLETMMRCLDEEAVFVGSGHPLTKPQIREFFQVAFQRHPNLRVEFGPLAELQGTIQVQVKVETSAIWTDTWIFTLKNHRIHSYALASAKR